MKYFVLAKQNDNNPEIELWIESHKSEGTQNYQRKSIQLTRLNHLILLLLQKGLILALKLKNG